jgi:antitoxin VapB
MANKRNAILTAPAASPEFEYERKWVRQDHRVSEPVARYFANGSGEALPMGGSGIDASVRRASLFRNGRNQAVRIPREFELPPGEVHIYKDGNRIIIEPIIRASDLAALFASWEPLTDEFPDVDGGLQPLNDVVL